MYKDIYTMLDQGFTIPEIAFELEVPQAAIRDILADDKTAEDWELEYADFCEEN